jgi:hypothetical protein
MVIHVESDRMYSTKKGSQRINSRKPGQNTTRNPWIIIEQPFRLAVK